MMVKHYYQLTKPGIVMGNAITIIGGFILASQGHIDYFLLAVTLMGLSLVIASGCIFNNYIDRFIDEKMTRTKNRPLVTGVISLRNALLFASVLGSLGFLLLAIYTNWLTVSLAALGFFVYVFVYTLLKSRTGYCTEIGSIAGSMPLVVGYCAVTNRFDLCAAILFMMMVAWQMPHFFAIAMYRIRDYQAASIPVLPVKRGNQVTKVRMLCYVIAFMGLSSSLTWLGFTGYAYLVAALVVSAAWLILAIKGFKAVNDHQWARHMFKVSLLVITTLCIMIAIDSV
jgi:heme o synthase